MHSLLRQIPFCLWLSSWEKDCPLSFAFECRPKSKTDSAYSAAEMKQNALEATLRDKMKMEEADDMKEDVNNTRPGGKETED